MTRLSSNVLTTEAELQEFVDYALAQGAVAFDVETSGEDRGVPHLNNVSWISLATTGRSVVFSFDHPIGTKVVGETKEPRRQANGVKMFRVPVYEPPPPQLDRARALAILEPLFFTEEMTLIAHGAQFDLATVAKYYGGRIPTAQVCCTITLQWLIDENLKRYGLKYRTKDVYGFYYDDEEVGRCIEKYPYATVAHYSYCDALYCWLEYKRLIPQIAKQKLTDLYNLEMRIVRLSAQLRLTGIRVDKARLEQMRAELTPQVQELEAEIYRAAGRKFNIGSWQQKQDILFLPKRKGGQGLRPWKLTKSAAKRKREAEKRKEKYTPGHRDWSTDDEALDSHRGNPVVDALLDWSDVNKILTTYVLGYLGVESDVKKDQKPCRIYDERIYAEPVPYGTKTGRYSYRDPNLQNVPTPDPDDPRNLGKLIRGAYLADEGSKLIVADYDQIELVILAHFVQQGALYEGFFKGIDPHTMTAAMVLGEDPADITGKERKKYGKSLNFAVVYGAGIMKVASMIGCSKEEAREILNRHREEFPEIYAFKDEVLEGCKKMRSPHIRTLLGRKRRVPEINWSDSGMRSYAERQAFNALVQGSSADLIKLAQTRYEDLRAEGDRWAMKQLLTVHDELVTTAPDSMVDEASWALREAMTGEGIQRLVSVPLKVELAVVSRWSEAK